MKKILENFSSVRVFFDSRVEWYDKDGEIHRTDGPAVITTEGEWLYYLNGVNHDFDEWSLLTGKSYV